MRIGPLEIAWSPQDLRHIARVWHRAPAPARLLESMTPNELRTELARILQEMDLGRSPYIPRRDTFRRIHFFDNERA